LKINNIVTNNKDYVSDGSGNHANVILCSSIIHDDDENNNFDQEDLLIMDNLVSFQSNCAKAVVCNNVDEFRSNYAKLLAVCIVENKECIDNMKKMISFIVDFNKKMCRGIRFAFFKDMMTRNEDAEQTIFLAFDGFVDTSSEMKNSSEDNIDEMKNSEDNNINSETKIDEVENLPTGCSGDAGGGKNSGDVGVGDGGDGGVRESGDGGVRGNEDVGVDSGDGGVRESGDGGVRGNEDVGVGGNSGDDVENLTTSGSNDGEEEDSSNELVGKKIHFTSEELMMFKGHKLFEELQKYDKSSSEWKELDLMKICVIQKLHDFSFKYVQWTSSAIFIAVAYIFKKRLSGNLLNEDNKIQSCFEEVKVSVNSMEKCDASNENFRNQIAKLNGFLITHERWRIWQMQLTKMQLTNGDDYWGDGAFDNEECNKLLMQHINFDNLRLLLVMIADYIEYAFIVTKNEEGKEYFTEMEEHSFASQLRHYQYNASTSKELENVSRKINWQDFDISEALDRRIAQVLFILYEDRIKYGRKRRKTKK
jgi:hypothetical protein